MTLSVAWRFPTEELINFEMSAGATRLERAVILASDSLYTRASERLSEPGEKVFVLARNSAAVIAGTVPYAIGALRETKRRMDELTETPNWERYTAIVHECFDVIPKEHIVECLIGMCPLSDEPNIIKVSSQSSVRFKPEVAEWHAEIGADKETREAFCQLMNDRTRLSGAINSPVSLSLRVVEALESTIGTNPDYIGGPVQSVAITREGLRIVTAFDIGSPDDITRITREKGWTPSPPDRG